MPAPTVRNVTTAPARPASEFEPLALLEAVRDVAERADVDEPRHVSTRAWDRVRPLSERFSDAPPARRIAERLGVPWAKVVELAFMPSRAQATGLGHALNEREGNWLTAEHTDFVLQLVARRLGVRTLTPQQYAGESAQMLAADRGRRHGGQLRFPNEFQIEAVAGTWDRALAHADLAPRQGPGGQRARSRPVGIVDVLDHYGVEPSFRQLEAFARGNGIPFPRKERGRPWSSYVDEWKAERRARGMPVPRAAPLRGRAAPDFSRDVGAARPGERRGRKRWDDRDEVVDWMARYLAQLGRRERSSQRGYDRWVATQEGAPWSSVLDAFGGFDTVRRSARELLRRRGRGASAASSASRRSAVAQP